MKRIKVWIRTSYDFDFFEVEDDASKEEIEKKAIEVRNNMADWGYYETKIKEEDEED